MKQRTLNVLLALLMGMTAFVQQAMADDIPIVFMGERLTTKALSSAPKGMKKPVEVDHANRVYTVYPGGQSLQRMDMGLGKQSIEEVEGKDSYHTYTDTISGKNWIVYDGSDDYTLRLYIDRDQEVSIRTYADCIMATGSVEIFGDVLTKDVESVDDIAVLHLISQHGTGIECKNLITTNACRLTVHAEKDVAVRLNGTLTHGDTDMTYFNSPRGAIAGIKGINYVRSMFTFKPYYLGWDGSELKFDANKQSFVDPNGAIPAFVTIRTCEYNKKENLLEKTYPENYSIEFYYLGHRLSTFNKSDVIGDNSRVTWEPNYLKKNQNDEGLVYDFVVHLPYYYDLTCPAPLLTGSKLSDMEVSLSGQTNGNQSAHLNMRENKLFSCKIGHLDDGLKIEGSDVLAETKEELYISGTSSFSSKKMPFKAKRLIFEKSTNTAIEYGTQICDCPVEFANWSLQFYCDEVNSKFNEVTYDADRHVCLHSDNTVCHQVVLMDRTTAGGERPKIWVDGKRLTKREYKGCRYSYPYLYLDSVNLVADDIPNIIIGEPDVTIGIHDNCTMVTNAQSNIQFTEEAMGTATINCHPWPGHYGKHKLTLVNNSDFPYATNIEKRGGGDLVIDHVQLECRGTQRGIENKKPDIPSMLTFNFSNVSIESKTCAVSGWDDVMMMREFMRIPSYGNYDVEKKMLVDNKGNAAPLMALTEGGFDRGLRVAGIEVSEENEGDIFGDGTAAFEYSGVLRLNSANLQYKGNVISEGTRHDNDHLDIELIGHNVITCTDAESYAILCEIPLYFKGDGTLDIISEGSGIKNWGRVRFEGDCHVKIDAKKVGIEGEATSLGINNASTIIMGGEQAVSGIDSDMYVESEEVFNSAYNESAQTYYTASGEVAKQLAFFNGQLGLILAGKAVTMDNRLDIMGDGSASYDPMRNVLVLKDAKVDGTRMSTYAIYSPGNLTIELHGKNIIDGSIMVEGNLKFCGDGRVDQDTSDRVAVSCDNTFEVRGGCVVSLEAYSHSSAECFSVTVNYIVVDNSTLQLRGKYCASGRNIKQFHLTKTKVLTEGVQYNYLRSTLLDADGKMAKDWVLVGPETGMDMAITKIEAYDDLKDENVSLKRAVLIWPETGNGELDMEWELKNYGMAVSKTCTYSLYLYLNGNLIATRKDVHLDGNLLPGDTRYEYLVCEPPVEYAHFDRTNNLEFKYVYTDYDGSTYEVSTTVPFYIAKSDADIDALNAIADDADADGAIYDLQGRPATKQASKGLYITKGKKYLVK